MDKINISVFFPCFNEEQNIGKLIHSASQYLPTVASDYEIIVVDDGSIDTTYKVAQDFAKTDSHVRVLRHETNRGYGAALRTGFQNCVKDYIFFTDGDNQFDIAEMTKLLPYIGEYDIVTGFREKRQDNVMRKINEFAFNRLIRILFGLKIRDLNCAFKIYKKVVIQNLTLKSDWGFINSELQSGASMKVVFGSLREVFRLRKDIK
jgi:glycosyltransferase involved in cell wall biosynthesis